MKPFDDPPLVPLRMGDDLGPYRIYRRLSSPQGTELYQALDRADPAAPLVRLEVWVEQPHDEFMQLYWDEAALFTLFHHAAFLRLQGLGNEGRRYYMVLPWRSARSLRAWHEAGSGLPWPVGAALSMARDVALGLGALHRWTLNGASMNAIYGALSAESILVSARGRVLLRPVPVAGKIGYGRPPDAPEPGPGTLSPEAVLGLPRTPAADVASLGAVLYRLLTGASPYEAGSPIERLQRIAAGRFAPPRALRPDLPASVERLVQRSMARDPSGRPADGDALARAIEATAAEEGIALGAAAVRRALREIAGHRSRDDVRAPRHPYRD
ncbi:serine/threonine protein kinase [Sorangium sp. So ce385]|uniref:serine/threonine protein kinase n=1 Tax=Sorangium sp. So ce385 TaxID=3133308 RepID=UPI003F5B4FC3